LLEMRRCQPSHLFKLGRKMRHTAVMHQVSDFRKIEFIIDK
jgi:hypothetical protein